MQIFIYKNGQQIGPLSEAEVKSQLAMGILSRQDLVWWEGQAGWTPLEQTQLAASLAGAPPPPPSTPPVLVKKSGNGPLIAVIIGCGAVALLPIIAIVAISVLLALGQTVRGVFSTINSQLMAETNNAPSPTTTNTAPTNGQ